MFVGGVGIRLVLELGAVAVNSGSVTSRTQTGLAPLPVFTLLLCFWHPDIRGPHVIPLAWWLGLSHPASGFVPNPLC
jgi:hypothetical protein